MADLVTGAVVNSSATDIAGFLAGADGIDGDTVSLQGLKRNHGLVILHVVPAQQQNPSLFFRHFCSLWKLRKRRDRQDGTRVNLLEFLYCNFLFIYFFLIKKKGSIFANIFSLDFLSDAPGVQRCLRVGGYFWWG